MSWLLEGMRQMAQEVDTHIAWVDACNHGMDLSKSWAFLSNSPEIEKVACLCPHGIRQSMAGKRNSEGVFSSTLTAEYPLSLARDILRHTSYLVTTSGLGEVTLPAGEAWHRPFVCPRHKPCDGAASGGPDDLFGAARAFEVTILA